MVSMASEDECEREIFVMIKWRGMRLAVPLMNLVDINADASTHETIEDWQYWINMGYEF